MRLDYVTFINTLNDKLSDFELKKSEQVAVDKKSYLRKVQILLLSAIDYFILSVVSSTFKKRATQIYFTHSSFIKKQGDEYVDVLYQEILDGTNALFISYDKYNYFDKVSGVKVYNLGVVVRILAILNIIKPETTHKNFTRWKYIVEKITKKLENNRVYIPSYSNETGLSLVFNDFRKNYVLIEVQHGSVINYPPYSFAVNFPIVDEFYFRNTESKVFLLKNIFAGHPPKMIAMNTPKINFGTSTSLLEILYISSYEFSGFHPVFLKYLDNKTENFHVKVRLHPRQMELEETFVAELQKRDVSFTIDKTKYWFEMIPANTIVISPFSSVIEEAVNIGLKVIIIDKVGAKRFAYLINGENCIFSSNLCELNLKK